MEDKEVFLADMRAAMTGLCSNLSIDQIEAIHTAHVLHTEDEGEPISAIALAVAAYSIAMMMEAARSDAVLFERNE